jgi:hypothetical protein
MSVPSFQLGFWHVQAHHEILREDSAGPGGAVITLKAMLTKGEGLSAAQLGAVTQSAHLSFTGVGMFLRVHLHVVLREAARTMIHKERAVSSI